MINYSLDVRNIIDFFFQQNIWSYRKLVKYIYIYLENTGNSTDSSKRVFIGLQGGCY